MCVQYMFGAVVCGAKSSMHTHHFSASHGRENYIHSRFTPASSISHLRNLFIPIRRTSLCLHRPMLRPWCQCWDRDASIHCPTTISMNGMKCSSWRGDTVREREVAVAWVIVER